MALGGMAAFAVLIFAVQELRQLHYAGQLKREIEEMDGCSVIEILQYGKEQGFRPSWAYDLLADAARRGDYRTLGYFSYTANFDREISDGQTALRLAAANGHFNAVKYLLVQCVDTELRDANGVSAFDSALTSLHPEVAALISASNDASWPQVLQLEESLSEFVHRSGPNRKTIDRRLKSIAYSHITSLRIDQPTAAAEGEWWFRGSSNVCIGIVLATDSEGYTGVNYAWLVDGHRVDEVQYFYPPEVLE